MLQYFTTISVFDLQIKRPFMRKFLFLLFVVIVGFAVDDVQEELVTLDWSNSAGSFYEDAGVVTMLQNTGFPITTSNLPEYSRIYPVGNFSKSTTFVIENPVFEEIEAEIQDNVLKNVPDNIAVNTTLLKSANEYKQELKIVPIKKENGKVYRLVSFQLKSVPVALEKSATQTFEWKDQSILNSGIWQKISTSGKGIYKIPYSTLSSWGFTNPQNVGVYGAGGTPLSENPGDIAYDDLPQCAVWHGQSDGADCLFFYAPGVTVWKANSSGYFTHRNNDYATRGYFFLNENANSKKELETLPEVTEDATQTITSFDDFAFYEQDRYNLLPLGSGKSWYGDRFGLNTNRSYNIAISDPDKGEDARLLVKGAARSSSNSRFEVSVSSTSLGYVNFSSIDRNETYGSFADEGQSLYNITSFEDQLDIDLVYEASDVNAEAWLDYIELNYRRNLTVGSNPVFFRDVESVGSDNIIEFEITNGSSDSKILDVTDFANASEVPFSMSGNTMVAKRPGDELREYVVFNPNAEFKEPNLVDEIENQNLHGLSTPEFLIISHSNFLSSAEELAAFHRDYDGMDVAVVNVEKVYNEFSSGTKSATGIRNFIKMFYDRGEGLKYVLLLGDGSYDNKGIDPERNNFIPTYQSANSLTPTSSFVTDDYFVLLDDGESVTNGAIDLGIGRIPAETSYQAQLVVDKIKRYYQPEALGDWRNVITFIGDDENSGDHMKYSEALANAVNKNNSAFVTDKIYFDAYAEQSTPSGDQYPDVNAAINKRVNDGVLILNYMGHANSRYLAHERVLDISDINAWSNTNTLPIFVTATCEFSRFDTDNTSGGEYVLFNPNGGAIGLFSTTRVVYSIPNFTLSKSFYRYIFANDTNGEHYRMGDVMRLAKVSIGNSINKRNFSLLADPALRLSFPKYKIVTSTINQEDAVSSRETLGALEKVTITGYVSDVFGNKIDNFNGELTSTVYDKEVSMQTLGNNGQQPVNFKVRENVIYKGESSVSNGNFTFSFVVPKDISYNIGEGKIVYYAEDGLEDAHGAFTNFDIGGSSGNITDSQGPEIELFLDSHDFKSGDKTGRNPLLLANLSDENGINTVGTGIGHDITAVIDDDYSNVFVLNNYYQSNTDDYTSGTISFPISGLSEGKHTLKLKAWDVANNSSEVEVEFEVTGDLIISDIRNYPNPVTDHTYFVLEHNQAGATLDVIFDIYDMYGRSIDRFQTSVGSNGSTTNPVRWDIAESNIADTQGIYIYRAIVQNSKGIIASKSGKMIIAH